MAGRKPSLEGQRHNCLGDKPAVADDPGRDPALPEPIFVCTCPLESSSGRLRESGWFGDAIADN